LHELVAAEDEAAEDEAAEDEAAEDEAAEDDDITIHHHDDHLLLRLEIFFQQ
jgi:hypothetical protein